MKFLSKRKPTETIGECEWCGLVDHHLVDGECPRCRKQSISYGDNRGETVALGVESAMPAFNPQWGRR